MIGEPGTRADDEEAVLVPEDAGRDGVEPQVRQCVSYEAEAHAIAEWLQGRHAAGYQWAHLAVLFPERSLEEALPALEELRAAIEAYRMTVRSDDRPRNVQEGSLLRSARDPSVARTQTDKVLSVTVSMGVAGRDARNINPAMAIQAADQALYRAKRAGRNRVSE